MGRKRVPQKKRVLMRIMGGLRYDEAGNPLDAPVEEPTSSSVDTQAAVNLETLTPEERRALAVEHGFDDDGYDYVQHLAVTNRTQLAPTFMTTRAQRVVTDETTVDPAEESQPTDDMLAAYRDELADIDRALMSSGEEEDEDDDIDEVQPDDYDAFPDNFVLEAANESVRGGDVAMDTDERVVDTTREDAMPTYVPTWGNEDDDEINSENDDNDEDIGHVVMNSAGQTAREMAERFNLLDVLRQASKSEKEPTIKQIPDDAEARKVTRERMRALYGQHDEDGAMQPSDDDNSDNDVGPLHVEREPEERYDIESIRTVNTTLYNHPTSIGEPSIPKRRPIKVDRQGIVISSSALPPAPKQRCVNEDDVTMRSTASSARPKDETLEEKRARKRLEKERRRERRQEKKANKMAFRVENIRQQRQAAAGGAKQNRMV